MLAKSTYFMFFVCFALWGLIACSSKPKDNFQNLSADQFEELILDENVQCVDVRTPAEYNDGHIPNSTNINVSDDSFAGMADDLLEKERPVAVYCRSGKRSRKAANILQKKGFVVYNLDKGYMNWTELGKSTVQ